MTSPDDQNTKRSRALSLMDNICGALERFLEESRAGVHSLRLPSEVVQSATRYLHEIGLTGDAERLANAYSDLSYSAMDLPLAEIAAGQSDEFRKWLEEEFGPFPEKPADAADDDGRWLDQRIATIGRAAQMRDLVVEIRGVLAPRGDGDTETTPQSAGSQQPRDDLLARLDPDAFLCATDLAKRTGKAPDALRKRLDRWRKQHPEDTGWIENQDRRANQPAYLYSVGAVRHVVEAAPASNRTSS